MVTQTPTTTTTTTSTKSKSKNNRRNETKQIVKSPKNRRYYNLYLLLVDFFWMVFIHLLHLRQIEFARIMFLVSSSSSNRYLSWIWIARYIHREREREKENHGNYSFKVWVGISIRIVICIYLNSNICSQLNCIILLYVFVVGCFVGKRFTNCKMTDKQTQRRIRVFNYTTYRQQAQIYTTTTFNRRLARLCAWQIKIEAHATPLAHTKHEYESSISKQNKKSEPTN